MFEIKLKCADCGEEIDGEKLADGFLKGIVISIPCCQTCSKQYKEMIEKLKNKIKGK